MLLKKVNCCSFFFSSSPLEQSLSSLLLLEQCPEADGEVGGVGVDQDAEAQGDAGQTTCPRLKPISEGLTTPPTKAVSSDRVPAAERHRFVPVDVIVPVPTCPTASNIFLDHGHDTRCPFVMIPPVNQPHEHPVKFFDKHIALLHSVQADNNGSCQGQPPDEESEDSRKDEQASTFLKGCIEGEACI